MSAVATFIPVSINLSFLRDNNNWSINYIHVALMSAHDYNIFTPPWSNRQREIGVAAILTLIAKSCDPAGCHVLATLIRLLNEWSLQKPSGLQATWRNSSFELKNTAACAGEISIRSMYRVLQRNECTSAWRRGRSIALAHNENCRASKYTEVGKDNIGLWTCKGVMNIWTIIR